MLCYMPYGYTFEIYSIHLSGGTIRQSHVEDSVWYTVMYSDCCAVNPESEVFVKTKK